MPIAWRRLLVTLFRTTSIKQTSQVYLKSSWMPITGDHMETGSCHDYMLSLKGTILCMCGPYAWRITVDLCTVGWTHWCCHGIFTCAVCTRREAGNIHWVLHAFCCTCCSGQWFFEVDTCSVVIVKYPHICLYHRCCMWFKWSNPATTGCTVMLTFVNYPVDRVAAIFLN